MTVILLAGLLPLAFYEIVQKTAEAVGPRGPLLSISCEAEDLTRWRPRSGLAILDHAQHELAETYLFWSLTAHHALGRERVRWARRPSSSALPIEFVDG